MRLTGEVMCFKSGGQKKRQHLSFPDKYELIKKVKANASREPMLSEYRMFVHWKWFVWVWVFTFIDVQNGRNLLLIETPVIPKTQLIDATAKCLELNVTFRKKFNQTNTRSNQQPEINRNATNNFRVGKSYDCTMDQNEGLKCAWRPISIYDTFISYVRTCG